MHGAAVGRHEGHATVFAVKYHLGVQEGGVSPTRVVIHTHICIYAYVYVCMYVYIYVCMYIYIYIYINV